MLSPLLLKCKYFASNLLLVWITILFYFYNPYYVSFLLPGSKAIILSAAILYTLYFPIYLFLTRHPEESKGYLVLRGIKRLLPWVRLKKGEEHKLTHQEKTALLFMVVKAYFLPLMVNFAVGNFRGVAESLSSFNLERLFDLGYFVVVTYPLLILLIFFVDTFYFAFGYLFESKALNNEVRSVEPTALGWISALLCYPPFNGGITEQFSPWYPNLYASFGSPEVTAFFYGLILLCLFVYLLGTLALGTKCGNLINRGIVSHGPYAYVRHPHYISKNLAWWLALLPVMSLPGFLSMLVWSGIYFVRALTEEKHLLADPDYQAYVKKVPYRFIPGVY